MRVMGSPRGVTPEQVGARAAAEQIMATPWTLLCPPASGPTDTDWFWGRLEGPSGLAYVQFVGLSFLITYLLY